MSGRVNLILTALLVLCALSLVNAQYQARRLFIELERSQSVARALDIEWSQLQLDQSRLGLHSRIDETVDAVVDRLSVGDVYVNRNMIGAVVGVQPFGGHGLSGTGPKAGGPHYLPRLGTEQTVTINTAAAGGNVGLMAGK